MARPHCSWPWLTSGVVLLAALIAATENGPAWAALERGTNAGWWSWWTTHAVHVSTSHLLASGLVWLTAGAAVERLSRGSVALLLLAGAPVIAWVALVTEAGMSRYVGLSGLACGCVAWLGLELACGARVEKPGRLLGALLLLGLLVRIGWDVLSAGEAWIAEIDAPQIGTVRVARFAHLAGALAGAVCWIGHAWRHRARSPATTALP